MTTTEAKPTVTYEQFAALDLRIATITSAEPHPNADRLLKLQLDDGSGEPRQICAGIKGHYNPDDLTGRQIVIVANLAPRKIRGEESRGMLLAASELLSDDSGSSGDSGGDQAQSSRRVVLLRPDEPLPPGSPVS